MRNLYSYDKDAIKRSSTTSKPINIAKTTKTVQVINQSLKYYVGAGNNNHLIRRIMSTRKNWEEISDSKQILLSFKWQQSDRGYNYNNCSGKKLFKHVLNHFQYHTELSNKEYLFKNILEYCETNKMNAFEFIPITFILNTLDSNFEGQQASFLHFYNDNNQIKPTKPKTILMIKKKMSNMMNSLLIDKKINPLFSKYEIKQAYTSPNSKYLWILKPTYYNRGNGVHVFNHLTELQTLINKLLTGAKSQKSSQTPQKKSYLINTSTFVIISTSFVVQKYMERPLLFEGRKFDIRVWVLFSHEYKVYLFKQGYMRTSSLSFELNQDKINDLSVHLTNNAVQKYTQNYNKFQKGNQLSFKYLKTLIEQKGKKYENFIMKMKDIIKISALSVKKKLNRLERDNCFQIFGYDFMVDDIECNPWLIEVNTNPCIEESSPVLQQLLPRMLDDAFSLTLDKIYPSEKTVYSYPLQNESNQKNLWQIIVDLKA